MAGSELVAYTSATPALYEKYPLLDPDSEMADALRENLGEDAQLSIFDLERVKIPAGGGTTWDLQDEAKKTLEGTVIGVIKRRSFWEEAPEEGGTGNPPDCSSPDGKIGHGLYGVGSNEHPSGECEDCPMNVFADLPNGRKGPKPCKEQWLLLFLRHGQVLPIVVQLAPTSIKEWRKFVTSLTARGLPFFRAALGLSLKRVGGTTGPAYSVIEVSLTGTIEEAEQLKALGDSIKAGYAEQSIATAPDPS